MDVSLHNENVRILSTDYAFFVSHFNRLTENSKNGVADLGLR